tara:strand:+ start:27570 stop:27803 length:234 start_codon:yes stop_codon:yes gene_type:complete
MAKTYCKDDVLLKTKTYTLTFEEMSSIAERELPAEQFWADGEHTTAQALKSLVYQAERGYISRITFDYYMEEFGNVD